MTNKIKSGRSSIFWKIYGLSQNIFFDFYFFNFIVFFFTGWYISYYFCVFFKLFTRGVASHRLLGLSHLRKKERKKGKRKGKKKGKKRKGKTGKNKAKKKIPFRSYGATLYSIKWSILCTFIIVEYLVLKLWILSWNKKKIKMRSPNSLFTVCFIFSSVCRFHHCQHDWPSWLSSHLTFTYTNDNDRILMLW